MKLGAFIHCYRKKHKLTMEEFAQRSGLSKSYISVLEKGKHPQNNRELIPSIETVEKVARGMNLSIDELLAYIDGEQPIDISHKTVDTFVSEKTSSYNAPPLTPIPIIDKITNENSILAEDNIVDVFYAGANVDADFCVKCKDDLNGVAIQHGDFVFIRQTTTYVDDRLYALITHSDNIPRIRRIYIESDFLVLDSCNPNRRPLVVDKNQIQIIGECVGVYRSF